MALNYDASDPTQIPVPGPIRGNYDPALLPLVDVVDLGGAFIKSAVPSGGTLTLTVQQADGTEAEVVFNSVAAGGIPTYSAGTLAYDGSAATQLTGTIAGVTTLPVSAELWFIIPSNIDLDDTALRMRIAGRDRPLTDLNGNAITAKQFTPRSIHIALIGNALDWRVVDPLLPRPQDFVIHLFMFLADNDPDHSVTPYPDPVFTLTQDKVDAAVYHTQGANNSTPRVDWVDSYTPSRNVVAGDDAYDDFQYLSIYAAVPDDAPDIRGAGAGHAEPRGWNGNIDGIGTRVLGTFDVGGVPHKFFGIIAAYVAPDYDSGDPPTDWLPWVAGRYSVMAFEGHPDPPVTL